MEINLIQTNPSISHLVAQAHISSGTGSQEKHAMALWWALSFLKVPFHGLYTILFLPQKQLSSLPQCLLCPSPWVIQGPTYFGSTTMEPVTSQDGEPSTLEAMKENRTTICHTHFGLDSFAEQAVGLDSLIGPFQFINSTFL